MLDQLRPHEIDFAAKTVREVFQPSVEAAGSIAWTLIEDHMPQELRQIKNLDTPMSRLNTAFAASARNY